MQKAFLTFFYSGLSPKAPGTIGTLASIPFGLFVLYYLGVGTLLLLTILISVVAVGEINKYEANGGEHDNKHIVIDETVGIWLAIAISYTISDIWFLVISTFVFFRLFDIWKPSIIGRIDREVGGGLGVVGDDLVAGFFAGISSQLCWVLAQKLYIVT